jgi:hypothetical protein
LRTQCATARYWSMKSAVSSFWALIIVLTPVLFLYLINAKIDRVRAYAEDTADVADHLRRRVIELEDRIHRLEYP